MHKKVFKQINLTCVFQNTNNFGNATNANSAIVSQSNPVINGMLSQDEEGGILFQENLPRKREIRNTKLYEGKHVSLVRRKDGLYYPLVKGIRAQGHRPLITRVQHLQRDK